MTTPMQTLVIVIEGDNPDFAEEALRKAMARVDELRPSPITLTGYHRKATRGERVRAGLGRS